MDLTAPISYNGLTISPPTQTATGTPRSGYEYNRLHTDVEVDGYLDGRANENGVDASDVFLRARLITIDGSVYGSSKGDLWDKQAALLEAFNPVIAYNADTGALGFLPFDFRWPTADTATYPLGYIPQRYYARPAKEPAFTINRVQSSGTRGGSMGVRLTLVAKDPIRYAQTATSITLATSSVVLGLVSSNTGTALLAYAGSLPVWPTFVLTNISPYDRPLRLGGNVQLNGHTYAFGSSTTVWDQGDVLTIDTASRRAYWQDGTDWTSNLTITGGWGGPISEGSYTVTGTSTLTFDPGWASDPNHVDDSERTYAVGRLTLAYRQAYA